MSELKAFDASPLKVFHASPLKARGRSVIYDTWRLSLPSVVLELTKHGSGAFSTPVVFQTIPLTAHYFTREGLTVILRGGYWGGGTLFQHEAWSVDPTGFTGFSLDDTTSLHPGWDHRTDSAADFSITMGGAGVLGETAANPFITTQDISSALNGGFTTRGWAVHTVGGTIANPFRGNLVAFLDPGGNVAIPATTGDVNRPTMQMLVTSTLKVEANV